MKRVKETFETDGFNPRVSQYVNVTMQKETVEIIQNCIKNHIFYGIFPVFGDSMTCKDKRSIPHGSGILVYDLQIDCTLPLIKNVGKIPMGVPLALVIKNEKRKTECFVKTITFIDAVHNTLRLTSYNPRANYNNWVPASWIERIFKVIQVIKKEDLNIKNKS